MYVCSKIKHCSASCKCCKLRVLTPKSPLPIMYQSPCQTQCHLGPYKCPCQMASHSIHECDRRHTHTYRRRDERTAFVNRRNSFQQCHLKTFTVAKNTQAQNYYRCIQLKLSAAYFLSSSSSVSWCFCSSPVDSELLLVGLKMKFVEIHYSDYTTVMADSRCT